VATEAWLGLGGNLGDPAAAMAAALRALASNRAIELLAVSSLYRTPPWGVTDQPDFLNAVASVRTMLGARGLLEACLEVERSLKRVRQTRWGPRLIDIDILVFGDQRIDEEGLHVPHPRMLERAFVMLPLAEISPDVKLEGRTARDWAAELDAAGIETLPGGRDWWREA
jgi:2-amino-4-hydroxy-6-hydroxymethyldihydropteridine diphosphokinase